MTGSREIELKLEIEARSDRTLVRRIAEIAGSEPSSTTDLRSVYFDTGKQALRRDGLALRIRHDGGRRIQTLKATRGGNLLDRAEWECALAGDAPDAGAFAEREAGDLLDGLDDLAPVFTTEVRRTLWHVEQGGATIEVALDRGRVSAGEAVDAFTEIELELKAGEPSGLVALARRLVEIGQVRIGVRTKSDRGFALLDGAASAASFKAEPVALEAGLSAGEAFQAVARSCLRQFRLNEALVRARREPGALHQARVALRRLRSSLAVFKTVAVDDEVPRIKADLKAISTLLGVARNLDVYRTRTIEPGLAADPPVPGIADLAARIEADRQAAYDRVVARLRQKAFRLFVLDLAAWIETGPWTTIEAVAKIRDASIADLARHELDRRRRAVKRRGKSLATLDPHDRHEVRIAAKKLRYAAEFFADLAEGRKAKRRQRGFVERLEALQSCLGDLNDIETARLIAPQIVDAAIPQETAFAAGHVTGEADEREARLVAEAAEAHAAFVDAKVFWR